MLGGRADDEEGRGGGQAVRSPHHRSRRRLLVMACLSVSFFRGRHGTQPEVQIERIPTAGAADPFAFPQGPRVRARRVPAS